LGREAFVTWFTEISLVEKEIDHCISSLKKWMKGTCVDTPMYLGPAKSRIVFEPRGVVAIIGSWNFPIFTVLAPLVNAIAAGNTAIVKPSELSPFICKKLINFFRANLDTDTYVIVEG
jgi:aldehyde dehydrogenase (NAD+)